MHLSETDIRKIENILYRYENQAEVQSMKKYVQHGSTSTYEHCIHVVFLSYWLKNRFHIKVNEKSLLVGALLHDFYLYDWHEKSSWHRLHGFHHSFRACKNARKVFQISDLEADIIENHMWPLTLRHIPRSREAAIVCLADKCCSLLELHLFPAKFKNN